MCNLYCADVGIITTNQAAVIALFRVVNRYVGNLPPMPAVFPDYPAPVTRNSDAGTEMVIMRWGMPPPPRTGGPPVTKFRSSIRRLRHEEFEPFAQRGRTTALLGPVALAHAPPPRE
jgi:putative SOS response-associated peptidase YedK